MSSFDPNLFVQTTVEDANSTEFVTIPEGEYTGMVKELKGRETKGGKALLDVVWTVDDESVRELTGMEEPTVRQSLFLDLTEGGTLALGKGQNVGLGRLREALGQNEPGKAWSPNQLVGQVATILITERTVPGEDGEKDKVYNDVKGVTPL